MRRKDSTYITVDNRGKEIDNLLWWIEEGEEPDDDSFDIDDFEALIEGSGRNEVA